jgi:hypothetical protein
VWCMEACEEADGDGVPDARAFYVAGVAVQAEVVRGMERTAAPGGGGGGEAEGSSGDIRCITLR